MKKRYLTTAAVLLGTIALAVSIWKPWISEAPVRKYAYIPTTLVDAPSTVGVNYLRAKGITPVAFVTGPETAQALMGGAAFVATMAEWPFLLASNNRSDLRVLAIMTSAESLGILADRSAGVESAKDFAGKRVGLPQGTSAQFLFESFFEDAGVLDKINVVNLPPPQLQPALLRGDIQGMVIWQPLLERARMQRPEDIYYLPQSQTAFRVVYLVVSTTENIRKDPAGIRKVLESLLEAEGALADRSPAAMELLRNATSLDSETLDRILPLFRFRLVLDDEIIDTWKKLAVWAQATGLAPKEVLNRNWKDFIYSDSLREVAPDRVHL